MSQSVQDVCLQHLKRVKQQQLLFASPVDTVIALDERLARCHHSMAQQGTVLRAGGLAHRVRGGREKQRCSAVSIFERHLTQKENEATARQPGAENTAIPLKALSSSAYLCLV